MVRCLHYTYRRMKELRLAKVSVLMHSISWNLSAEVTKRTRNSVRLQICHSFLIHRKVNDLQSKYWFGRERQEAQFWHGSVKHKSNRDMTEGFISPEKYNDLF